MTVRIAPEDLSRADLRELISGHIAQMHAVSPPESIHALDVDALDHPSIVVWTAREDGVLLGCGALKSLGGGAAEIKSMRTADVALGRGIGSAILAELIARAREDGLHEVSLETGAEDFFAPARRLYRRAGFAECGPFGAYEPDPHSVFMTLRLDPPAE